MSKVDYQKYDKILQEAKEIFKEGLLVINEILFKLPYVDIIELCKINLSLAKFLEEDRESQLAADNLEICIDRIIAYRNAKLARGVDTSVDLFLPFSLTCSNRKIKDMIA